MAGDVHPANDIHRANLDPVQREIDRFGPIARANFVAIQDEIDNPMTFGPSKEHPMTSPTQRRHDEILGRLDALIDAVRSTTARDNLHRLLAEESAAERRDELVDVTEEPYSVRCGRAVCDDENPQRSGCRCYKDAGHDGMHGCEHADWPVDTAPDVDPDEALAKFVWESAPPVERVSCVHPDHHHPDGDQQFTGWCRFPAPGPRRRRLVGPWEPEP